MKRERDEELKSNRGSPAIAFFDLASMSTTGSLIYLGGILSFFLIIFYVLINKLLSKPVDFQKSKRTEKLQKKSSKSASGKKSN